MGKKNKNSKENAAKNGVDVVQHKGGSTITKVKGHVHLKGKGNKDDNKKMLKDQPKVTDEKQIENINLGIAKKKRRKNKNKSQNGEAAKKDESKISSPAKEVSSPDEKNEKITKLTKREKNRVKSKMAKDIAMDGKSKLGLADPKLVARQLNKLKAATEPLSKAKQRKLLLLEKLNKKLQKDGTKTPNTSMNSIPDNDEEQDEDSSDASPEPSKQKAGNDKINKKIKSEAKKQKDKLFLFVGNLPSNVTEEMIRDAFKTVTLETIRIPVPKRKKSKRYAFIKLENEESKQKALQFHGSLLGERKITVLFSDKSKGKPGLVSANAKLNVERKSEAMKTNSPVSNGSPSKKSKNKKKKKGAAKA